jgi:hypothetical protein
VPPYRRFQQALTSGQHTGGALTDMDGGPTIRLLIPTQRPMRCAPEGQYMRFRGSSQRHFGKAACPSKSKQRAAPFVNLEEQG